ncbi:unnamed protein product [Parnassius apollo]|uniref:(apollo) hypothetical protein n=1 Tax=Parnassius apollo TaxID=110799 RepID=A0A8S3XFK2_PARAO|nr:unnamed protein product [Parnassius apollo]
MSDAKLKELVRKRGSLKAKLTHFATFLNLIQPCTSLNPSQLADMDFRLGKIESLYGELDVLQKELELMSADIDAAYSEREQFEEQY